jgi:hypothetical protein
MTQMPVKQSLLSLTVASFLCSSGLAQAQAPTTEETPPATTAERTTVDRDFDWGLLGLIGLLGLAGLTGRRESLPQRDVRPKFGQQLFVYATDWPFASTKAPVSSLQGGGNLRRSLLNIMTPTQL